MSLGRQKNGTNELGCHVYSVTMRTINSQDADFWLLLVDILLPGHRKLITMCSEMANQSYCEEQSRKINLL